MRKLLLLFILGLPATAHAQCALPIVSGTQWTIAQWNNCFNYLLTSTASSGGGIAGSNFNATFPSSGVAVGASYGGNMVSLGADAFNDLYVNLKTALPPGANTIGAVTQAGTWSTSLTGTVPLPTGAAVANLQGGTYNSTAPTLTNGQQATQQFDVNGNLKVNVVAGGSGGGSGGTSSLYGSSFPLSGTAIGAQNGGNMVSLNADGSNNLDVDLQTALPAGSNVIGGVTQSGAWSVGLTGAVPAGSNTIGAVSQNGTWNVGLTGAVPLPSGAATSALQSATTGTVIPGTAGTVSTLVGAVYSSTPPAVTNGQQLALQTDAAGNLLVNVKSGGGTGGTSSSFSATFPSAGTAIGAKNGGNMVSLAADSSNNLNVNLQQGGTYNSTAPTVTNGNQASLQLDSHGNLREARGSITLVALDVATVTTGGTAVTALSAGHRTNGGWILNPSTAAQSLCVNEVGSASGTTSSGSTTCVVPGQTYTLAPSANAVSVVSSDSSHAFSGYGFQ